MTEKKPIPPLETLFFLDHTLTSETARLSSLCWTFFQIKNDAAASEAYMTTLMYDGFWSAKQVKPVVEGL